MVYIFCYVAVQKKDCYRDFSIGQVGFGSRSILRAQPVASSKSASVCNGLKQIIIFGVFFTIFESGGITKHLMTGPLGNSEFCFLLDLNVPLGFRETKLTASLATSPAR